MGNFEQVRPGLVQSRKLKMQFSVCLQGQLLIAIEFGGASLCYGKLCSD